MSSLPHSGDWVTLQASSHRWLPLLVEARRAGDLENERSQGEAECPQLRAERPLLALVARGEKARQIAAAHTPHHPNPRQPPRSPSLSRAHFSDTARSLRGRSGQAGWWSRGRGTQHSRACGRKSPGRWEAGGAASLGAARTRPFGGPQTSPGRGTDTGAF